MPLSRAEAIAKLKEHKDLYDLGLISEKEYNILKEKLTPIIILILSAIFLKEKLTILKVIGIVLGLIGALALIFNNTPTKIPNAPNILLGNIMLVINATCFGSYLVIIKPLTKKYHTVTLMKWIFPIGIMLTFPITIKEFLEVDWLNLPFDAVWRMSYVVLGTTFFAYFLNVFALKTLNATTIGAFTSVSYTHLTLPTNREV